MIRPLVAADLDQVKAIDSATFPPEEQYDEGMYYRMLQSGLSLVALDDDQIVGYAFVQINPYTHVRSLAVHPSYRRRGYGRALMEAVIEEAEHEVDLLVLEDNAAAVRLYENLGFERAEIAAMVPSRRRMVLRLERPIASALKRCSIWTDARLSCVLFGDSGPPALLIHGLYGRATEWRSTAAWLCESQEVFALDQRGNGLSEKGLSDFSRDAQVKDAIATIETHARGPVLLIGQSMGGVTAFLTAARRPDLVDRLVTIEATSYSGGSGDSWLPRWPLPFADLEAARAFFTSQEVIADVWIDVLQKREDGYWPEFSTEDMEAAAADIVTGYDYRKEWASIRCPTLLVGGERSRMNQDIMREMASENPSASYICVTGAGHDVHLDSPDALRSAVTQFLSDK